MNRKVNCTKKHKFYFAAGLWIKPHLGKIVTQLFLCFFSCGIISNVCAQYSGGAGTQANPYQISSVNDLILLSQSPEHWAMWFVQTADINASVTQTINDGAGFNPIGNGAVNFTGYYIGNNYSISYLHINRPTTDTVGLFGFVFSPATISNLRLINANITGKRFVGILAGISWGTQIICHTSGVVNARDSLFGNCGGLIGANGGFVIRCSSSATVNALRDIVGGLLGTSSNDVSFSYSTGIVSGKNTVGGLIGSAANGTISQCYSSAQVHGQQRVGGFIGNATHFVQISNCYSSATIAANSSYTGGFIGLINSTSVVVNRCYSNTSIANTTGVAYVGGFTGRINNALNVQNSFWNVETSGIAISNGGIGKSDAEMKNPQTYLNEGWDFVCETTNGIHNFWGINPYANNGYPFLIWQGFPYDIVSPVIISSPNDTTINLVDNCEIELPDFRPYVIVHDNCTSNDNLSVEQIPGPGTLISGTQSVMLRIFDLAGNFSDTSFYVTVADNILPTIVCSQDTTILIPSSESFYIVGEDQFFPTAVYDNCGLELIYNSFNNSAVLTGASVPIGNHTIQWIAKDLAGNTSSCSFHLTVAHANVVEHIGNADSFQAFPNPISGIFTVIFNNKQERTLSMFDLQGRERVFMRKNTMEQRFEFDLSSLPTGVYILQVKTLHGVIIKKVVKQ